MLNFFIMKNLFFVIVVCFPLFSFAQLTGYWRTEVGGCYQIRQHGNEVWWVGESPDEKRGKNVFYGQLSGVTLNGIWCDMPSNPDQGCGEKLSFRIEGSNRMVKISETAPYQGRVWTRTDANCSACVERNLIQCNQYHCGFPGNKGIHTASVAQITVCSDGIVKVKIVGLRNTQTGQIARNTNVQIHFGLFGNQSWDGKLIGSFTTDANGNFEGATNAKVDSRVSKSIVLNIGSSSQFIAQ
jgi:hypothetical protein